MLTAVMLLTGVLRAADCTTVEADHILAADLARALPVFAALDPGLKVGYTPVPGTERVMSAAQLRRLARRHGLPETSVTGVCFARFTENLTAERILAAVRRALDTPEAIVELVDFSRKPAPKGEIEFRQSGLAFPAKARPQESVLWRGSLRYGNRRSMPVWVRVRISVSRRQVVALRDLAAGQVVRAEDVAEEVVSAFPAREPPLETPQLTVGVLLRRSIPAGEPLYASHLRLPNDVERGDVVNVEVISGAARLKFEARAETSGRQGDQVYVRNPDNGQRFRAFIEEKGKVVVLAGSSRRIL